MKQLFTKSIIMIFLILLGYLPIVYYNVKNDPYGIFKSNYKNQYIEPNQHFIKMKLLVENKISRNSFIFGSSRVGKIIPKKNSYIEGYYNMTYSEGVPSEHLSDIKILLENDIQINNLIIGLDNISYLVDESVHKTQMNRISYGNNNIITYLKYLTLTPSFSIHKHINIDQGVHYDFFNTGCPIVKNKDNWINDNKNIHIHDDKFLIPSRAPYYTSRVDEVIDELKEIKTICESNNISLKLFINPMHNITYLDQNFDDYFRFLSELSTVSEFYNFSGLNEITLNNFNYYETSHYRPFIGDLIIEVLFDESNSNKYLIKKDNIYDHINYLKNEIKNYRKM